jgi:hypothetical protein
LDLCAGSKAGMLGFFNPLTYANATTRAAVGCELFVRYSFRGVVYEVTVGDTDPITLPTASRLARRVGTDTRVLA